jgi:hypothetical protein
MDDAVGCSLRLSIRRFASFELGDLPLEDFGEFTNAGMSLVKAGRYFDMPSIGAESFQQKDGRENLHFSIVSRVLPGACDLRHITFSESNHESNLAITIAGHPGGRGL